MCVVLGNETARGGGGGSCSRHSVHMQEGVVETQSKNIPHSLCVSALPSVGWIHLHYTCLLRYGTSRNLFDPVNLLSCKGSIR